MTSGLGSVATAKVIEKIAAPGGLNANLAALTAPGNPAAAPVELAQVRAQNVAADLAERSSPVQFPSISIYCEKIINDQAEKFRTFSGHLQIAVEIRHSQDQLSGLQSALELYADSVAQTLSAARGDWNDGMFYGGGYEVALGPVKHGGKNFIQTAKVTFKVGVSRN